MGRIRNILSNHQKSNKHLVSLLTLVVLVLITGCRMSDQEILKRLDQVEKDFKLLEIGVASYGIDRCGYYYPPDTSLHRKRNPKLPLTFETDPAFIEMLRKEPGCPFGGTYWDPLTTPVAYVKLIPGDPFRNNAPYGFASWTLHDNSCVVGILYSPGPDGKEDVTLITLREKMNHYLLQRHGHYLFDSEEKGMIRDMIAHSLYDPTNGTYSRGDLIRVITPDGGEGNYGWRYPKWENASTTNLPAYLASTAMTISPGWKEGAPLPPPQSLAEKRNRQMVMMIPGDIWQPFVDMKILEKTNIERDLLLHITALQPLQNHLGVHFVAFIQHPRLLTKEENNQLNQWQKQTPDWWKSKDNALNIKISYNFYSRKILVSDLLAILPLYGKTQILLSAQEATQGDKKTAKERIERLRYNLKDIKTQLPPEPYWYQERVMGELNRLCDEMEKVIGG